LFVRERRRLHQDDTRNFVRGERSSLWSARPARTRLPGLRQRLVDLNLALHVAPPVFGFLRRPIFLPNKISRKDKKPTGASVRAKRLIVKSQRDRNGH
jgi:hypothetical protein